MKFLKKMTGILVLLVCALGLLTACTENKPTDTGNVTYTIEVVCEDTNILGGLEVQLVNTSGAPAASAPIVNGKATFLLPAATYTVNIVTAPGFEGFLDGYVFNIEMVTATTKSATVTITPEGEPSDKVSYTVTVLLPDGTPVNDIYAQLCGGPLNVCIRRKTNENGVAQFELDAGNYEVHIDETDWPNGYTFDDTKYTMDAKGGEITVYFDDVVIVD